MAATSAAWRVLEDLGMRRAVQWWEGRCSLGADFSGVHGTQPSRACASYMQFVPITNNQILYVSSTVQLSFLGD